MNLPTLRGSRAPERSDPFREFEDLYTQLGRWMDDMFSRTTDITGGWSPLADLSETEDAYLVEIDLPGVRREDVDIDLSGQDLTIQGEVKQTEHQGVFRRRTRRTGQFTYRLTLPQNVDAEKVEASLANGVLTVRVPKSEAAKPRRIEIKSN